MPVSHRQAIFFGGVDPSIRGEVWPFLLHYYSYDSTSQEREAWRLQKRTHYHDVHQRRYGPEGEMQEAIDTRLAAEVDLCRDFPSQAPSNQ